METEEPISIKNVEYDIKPEVGSYSVTFTTAAGTSITVKAAVMAENRVESKVYQEEIYAMNFFKKVEDIQESIALGYPIAYAIAQMNSRSNTIMILLITMPTWVNMLVRTYAWMGILQDEGILNTILGFFGIGPVSMIHTSFAVILGMVYNFIPFMILQIHTSLAKMDKSLLEAANDLGATPVQAFLRVTLPLSLPGVISGITLVVLPAVSSFFIPKLLGGGQYVLVGNIIETQFLTTGDWNFGSAISLIMAVIIMISMWLTRKADVQVASQGKE